MPKDSAEREYNRGENQEISLGLPIEILISMAETTYPIHQIAQEFRLALEQIGMDEDLSKR